MAVGEREHFVPVDDDHPEELAGPEHGDREHGPDVLELNDPVGVLGLRLRVTDVDRTPGLSRTRRGAATSGGERIPFDKNPALFANFVRRRDSEDLRIEAVDERAFCLAQPDRILSESLEHRLEIEGGPPDYLEELAGCRLLLEGLSQLTVARL